MQDRRLTPNWALDPVASTGAILKNRGTVRAVKRALFGLDAARTTFAIGRPPSCR